jgi:uncharacterized membrane protein (DUF106 family)
MTISDIITLVLGVCTILLAIVSLFNSFINTKLSHGQKKLQEGQVEMQIRDRISNARNRYEDLTLKLAQSKDADESLMPEVLKSAKEEFANAYDEACQKYLDAKVDKIRFEKSYFNEIKSIVENTNFAEWYIGAKTRYQATVKVYREWFQKE